MWGSHQKGSNWYRCQFVDRHGLAAAEATGHPRVLGIREEVVLAELFDVLSTRLFGPGRLEHLREELARTSAGGWQEHEAEIARRRELARTSTSKSSTTSTSACSGSRPRSPSMRPQKQRDRLAGGRTIVT